MVPAGRLMFLSLVSACLAVSTPGPARGELTAEDSLRMEAAFGGDSPESQKFRDWLKRFDGTAAAQERSRQSRDAAAESLLVAEQIRAIEVWTSTEGGAWTTGEQAVELRVERASLTSTFSCHFHVSRPLVIEPVELLPLFSLVLFEEVPELRAKEWTPTMRAKAKAWVGSLDLERLSIPYPFARTVEWKVVGTEPGRDDLFTVVGEASSAEPAWTTVHPEFGEFATYRHPLKADEGASTFGSSLYSSSDTYTFRNVPRALADSLELSRPGTYMVVQAAPVESLGYEDHKSHEKPTYGGYSPPRSRAHVVVRKEDIRRTWIMGPFRAAQGDDWGAFKPKPKAKSEAAR